MPQQERMFKKLLALTLPALVASSIEDCSQGTSLFRINAFGFWPDPALANQNSTLSFNFTVPGPDPITDGSVVYTYTYNYIPFQPTTDPLCTQTACPILPGDYNQSSSSNFPDLSGKVDIKIEWFDTSNTLLLCAQIKTTAS